jgi:hypothetical protein
MAALKAQRWSLRAIAAEMQAEGPLDQPCWRARRPEGARGLMPALDGSAGRAEKWPELSSRGAWRSGHRRQAFVGDMPTPGRGKSPPGTPGS